MKIIIIMLNVISISIILAQSKTDTESQISYILKTEGRFNSPGESYSCELKINPLGGFLDLYFSPEDIFPIEDVDAVMWINNSTLLFTVSPIYGCPGIFVYNYHNKLLKQIMKPKIIDKYFPCGADYFELAGFDFSNRTILFYYSSYVDSIDFNSFRSEKNLFRVKLNIED